MESTSAVVVGDGASAIGRNRTMGNQVDVYFSADVETDGPIPGPYSMLSFALVFAGTYDGSTFQSPDAYERTFYRELKPISGEYQTAALRVNRLDRNRLLSEGVDPTFAMNEAFDWIVEFAGAGSPALVAYPLSFDWTWLYWYFMRFCDRGSPFNHSRCFDLKTAFAVKAQLPVSAAGRSHLYPALRSHRSHTHHALDDAIEQAEIFSKIFQWEGRRGIDP